MSSAKLRAPYRQRILAYCQANGITVPENFDAPKSSDKFALLDLTTSPPSLVSRTTYLESEIVEFLARPENQSKRFRLLDFKRGVELSCTSEGKLEKIGAFQHISPGEINLVAP